MLNAASAQYHIVSSPGLLFLQLSHLCCFLCRSQVDASCRCLLCPMKLKVNVGKFTFDPIELTRYAGLMSRILEV